MKSRYDNTVVQNLHKYKHCDAAASAQIGQRCHNALRIREHAKTERQPRSNARENDLFWRGRCPYKRRDARKLRKILQCSPCFTPLANIHHFLTDAFVYIVFTCNKNILLSNSVHTTGFYNRIIRVAYNVQ